MQLKRPRLAAAGLVWLALIVLAATRCGHGKKDKHAPAAEVPADWDGQSDWAGSAMEVVDE